MARWNAAYINSQIEKEEKLYKYRSKLRSLQCTNHSMNIRSDCAQCRAEFWKDCKQIMMKEVKEETSAGIGMVNAIKSEAAAPSSGIN